MPQGTICVFYSIFVISIEIMTNPNVNIGFVALMKWTICIGYGLKRRISMFDKVLKNNINLD